MLNVRYGSGCRRRQTACAARPSLCRSRQAINSTPSSGVRRPPSTAFDKIRSMVADKGHPPGREAEFAREVVVPAQPGEFARAEVVLDDVGEVAAAVPRVEAEGRRLPLGDLAGAG